MYLYVLKTRTYIVLNIGKTAAGTLTNSFVLYIITYLRLNITAPYSLSGLEGKPIST
jgi:hypothetical protein